MTLREFEQLFKEVVEAYPSIDIEYNYNRAWYLDGSPSSTFPAITLERLPKVSYKGMKQNHLPMIEVFEFKVYFFDTYHYSERDGKEFSEKQTELLEIAKQVFAEITRRDRDEGHNLNFKYNGNFLGDIDMNPNELMEFSAGCTAELKVACDKLNFVYA